MDVVAALVIFANRAADDYLPNGIASPQNLPLAAMVLIILIFAEFYFRKKASYFHLILFLASAMLLLFCTPYLPPVGETATEEPSAFAYVLLMCQLALVVVVSFSRLPTLRRMLALLVFLGAASTLAGFIGTFSTENSYHGKSKVDAAVVLGASVWGRHVPSPLLRGRLEKAIETFKSGEARRLVVTGGTKRFGTVESEVQAWYLEKNGVPDSDIIVDQNTFCTSEQAIFVKKVLIDSLHLNSLVIVTDSWHLPRALLMCRWQGVPRKEVDGLASDYKLSVLNDLYFRVRESVAIQAFVLFGA